MSVRLVNARAQAEFAHRWMEHFTPEEADVFRRGRNAKSPSPPKNMSIADYKYATAMEAVIALGRPAKIQLFALIDRGHAELPIKANYVGKHIPTARREIVSVKVAEIDGENSVTIWSREETDS